MDRKYLVRQYNAWSVVVEVPKRLQAKAGKKRFKVSLGTDSLAEANRLKHNHVARFHREIALLEKGGNDKDANLSRLAAEFRQALDSSDRRWHEDEQGREWSEHEEELGRLREHARELEDSEGSEAAARFYKAATGQATLIKDQYPVWLGEVEHAGQTKSQHTSTIERYLRWSNGNVTIEETDRKKAGEYVTYLLTASGLARRTVKRHLSSLSSFWQWLESKGLVGEGVNPWLRHKLGKKKAGTERKGLSDEKILRILNGSYSTALYRQTLHDLVRLALLQGARLDELCSVKKADVHKREDGYWIVIGGGKTEAAARELPVHLLAVPIIERRLKGDGDDYLLEGLTPGGPDEKRSWYVSKAYGRFRNQPDVNVTERLEDFHALRNTFIALMEGLEVAESTVKLLVGHKRSSMTYGHYSKGERVNLRKAIERVDYGPKIMEAIASTIGSDDD